MPVRLTKALSLLVALVLTACGVVPKVERVLPDRKVEYKKEKQAEVDLEVPPDLTKTSIEDVRAVPDVTPAGTATYSDYVTERKPAGGTGGARVLPPIENITVKRDGDQRWLVVRAPVEDVWFKALSFWEQNHIRLLEQDPVVGIMRTSWIEHRADIQPDSITGKISKVFGGGTHSVATREQYRVRLEEGEEPGTTELFLTHRGMEEKLVADSGGDAGQPVWVIRPPDHELEAEMLRRMMVFFGVQDQQAKRDLARKSGGKLRSRLLQGTDKWELRIREEFPRAWRITGMALDRGGFAVEDRDRGKGIYYVRYNDPTREQEKKGFLSKLVFWGSDEKIDKETQYRVSLRAEGGATRVMVLDSNGERDNSVTARRILTLLHEQIK
ncbi:MAG TPA: outer membrane protein assembly factor BamC [Sedimenticola sp.]|nr:outer membrane protein assembly factor BamC [Sedimenticola sp.]